MGDTSRHITSFKVENFKRFESFEMNDLGQFNLIVGDNNVGKTSVLEALLVDDIPSWLIFNRLLVALEYRNLKYDLNYEDLELFSNRNLSMNKISYNINFAFTNINNNVNRRISLDFDKTTSKVSVKGIPNDSTAYILLQKAQINYAYNTPFVPFYKGHDEDLTEFYSKLEDSKLLKSRFIEALKTIIPDIYDITLSAKSYRHLIVYQTHIDNSLPLALFGDGALKLFRLLAEIVLNKGSRLMIDEIDTGIHYSRFREFWKVILRTAKENDVQLFMTTHNEECIRYFKEVLEEQSFIKYQPLAKGITLVENQKSKQVTAHTYSFEQFEHAINMGNEIRA